MELVAALAIAALVVQQVLHTRERATLLDRIQAPELVVARRAPDPSAEPLFVEVEDPESVEDYERDRLAGRTS